MQGLPPMSCTSLMPQRLLYLLTGLAPSQASIRHSPVSALVTSRRTVRVPPRADELPSVWQIAREAWQG